MITKKIISSTSIKSLDLNKRKQSKFCLNEEIDLNKYLPRIQRLIEEKKLKKQKNLCFKLQ